MNLGNAYRDRVKGKPPGEYRKGDFRFSLWRLLGADIAAAVSAGDAEPVKELVLMPARNARHPAHWAGPGPQHRLADHRVSRPRPSPGWPAQCKRRRASRSAGWRGGFDDADEEVGSMSKFVPYLSEDEIERDAAALLAEYATR